MKAAQKHIIFAEDGWVYDERGRRLQRLFETVDGMRIWSTRMQGSAAPVESLLFRLETRRDHIWNERLVPMMKEALRSKAKLLFVDDSPENEPHKAHFINYTSAADTILAPEPRRSKHKMIAWSLLSSSRKRRTQSSGACRSMVIWR